MREPRLILGRVDHGRRPFLATQTPDQRASRVDPNRAIRAE